MKFIGNQCVVELERSGGVAVDIDSCRDSFPCGLSG